MSRGSTKTTRETEIEKFITHRSWRKYTVRLQGPHEEVRAGHRWSQDLGHRPSLVSVGGVL